LQVSSARLSAMVHATEDPEKLLIALNQIYGPEVAPESIENRNVKGHFGNKIVIISASLRGSSAELLLSNLWRRLSSIDQVSLLDDLGSRVDEDGRWHIRLDKQECFRGQLRLKDQDPIKLEVSFHGAFDVGELKQILEPDKKVE
jgi:RNA-binding protein